MWLLEENIQCEVLDSQQQKKESAGLIQLDGTWNQCPSVLVVDMGSYSSVLRGQGKRF